MELFKPLFATYGCWLMSVLTAGLLRVPLLTMVGGLQGNMYYAYVE